MKLSSVAVASAVLALACTASSAIADDPSAAPGKQWSYKTNDPAVYGPAEWGLASPACGGKRQSPVDIAFKSECGDASQLRESVPLQFTGECPTYKIKQLYDAHKAEVVNGSCAVAAKGKPYEFLQTHLHVPAEHTVNGYVYDGEVHFVHKSNDGLLVIGLFLHKQQGAVTDPFLAKFWSQIEGVNANTTAQATLGSFFPALKTAIAAGKVFNYPGSLTNPTCDETVDWWVLEQPLKVSPADFDKLQPALERITASDRGRAARPTQPLNGRVISVY